MRYSVDLRSLRYGTFIGLDRKTQPRTLTENFDLIYRYQLTEAITRITGVHW